MQNSDSPNGLQAFSTLLALILPVLQIFFNFIPKQSAGIFLIQPYFLVISVIAAIFAYILIIAYKYTPWFALALNRRRNKQYKHFQLKIDPAVYDEQEIISNSKKYKVDPPYYINPQNVYLLLIPIIFLLSICFLAIGFFFKGSTRDLLVFIQAITYILLVALTSLTLGAFYINDSNIRKNEAVNKAKYRRVLQLLFDNRALSEFPVVEFIGQGTIQFDALTTIVRVNDAKNYKVETDLVAGVLRTVTEIPDSLPGGQNDQ